MKAIVLLTVILLFSELKFYLANLGYFYLVNKTYLLILLFLFLRKILILLRPICFISSLFSVLQMAINIYSLSISIPSKVAN